MTRRIVLALAVTMMFAIGASADTVHGYCVSPASACSDNGTITPTHDNPPYFAFSYDGNTKNAHGDFLLIGLVPDNHNSGFSLTLDGTKTTNSTAAGVEVSSTEWNSGVHFLSSYLTSPVFPHNSHPIDAYLPSTQGVDSGAHGYFVYLFDFGAFNYKTSAGAPEFAVGSGAVPQGTVFLAALVDSGHDVIVDTPNSASILETGTAASSVPEPGTLAMMGTGVLGLAGILRRKLSA